MARLQNRAKLALDLVDLSGNQSLSLKHPAEFMMT